MHLHIYSFCGQPGCKDRMWHPNTEDLVSPQLAPHEVAGYFREMLDGVDLEYPDSYVIRPCDKDVCPNPEPMWLYIRRDDPLLYAIRPAHFQRRWDPTDHQDTWAKS